MFDEGGTLVTLVDDALKAQRTQPKSLAKIIDFLAETNGVRLSRPPIEQIVDRLKNSGPNDPVRHALAYRIQEWDHEDSPSWGADTGAHSDPRRTLILG